MLSAPTTWKNEDGTLVFYISKDQGQNGVLELDACLSSDENENQELTFDFQQLDGNEVTIEQNACKASVRGLSTEETLNFQLTVTDSGKPPLDATTKLEIVVKFAEPPKIVVENELKVNVDTKYTVIDASQSFAYDHRYVVVRKMAVTSCLVILPSIGYLKKNPLLHLLF